MSDDLSRPVPGETKDLELHVEMCARRHGAIMGELRMIRRVGYGAAVLLLSALSGGAITAADINAALRGMAQVASTPHQPSGGALAGPVR